jgi:hypothetical protein
MSMATTTSLSTNSKAESSKLSLSCKLLNPSRLGGWDGQLRVRTEPLDMKTPRLNHSMAGVQGKLLEGGYYSKGGGTVNQ